MFSYQYATLIFFLWIILWTSAKPVTKKDKNSEEPGTLSEKEKGSQEDIMFGNQQNKPAGMVDDILSFPEGQKDQKSYNKTSKSESESGPVREKEEGPIRNSINGDYDYEAEDGPHKKYRIPSLPLSNLLEDYPLFEEDRSIFRNKRDIAMLRNELEDLLTGRQHRGLRMKREVDLPPRILNLSPEEIIRFLPELLSEESNADENRAFHPNSYLLMDGPSGDGYWLENTPDQLEMIGNKLSHPYVSVPKRDSPYLYTPGNIVVLPSKQDTWNGRIDGGQPQGIRRRRPLTIEDESDEDDHFYDFLGMPEREFPEDL